MKNGQNSRSRRKYGHPFRRSQCIYHTKSKDYPQSNRVFIIYMVGSGGRPSECSAQTFKPVFVIQKGDRGPPALGLSSHFFVFRRCENLPYFIADDRAKCAVIQVFWPVLLVVDAVEDADWDF